MGGVVPLSEHEQRQLEQIEQALYREDRRLVRLVRSSDPHVHYRRRVVEALVGLALGAAMVAVGIILSLWGLAAGGFVVLLLCGIWAPVGKRRSRRSRRGRGQPARGSMMERFDERWRRRQEGGF
jgi:Flp pilus assembly protein TadB